MLLILQLKLSFKREDVKLTDLVGYVKWFQTLLFKQNDAV